MQQDNIGLPLFFVVKVMFVGGAAVMLAFLLVFLGAFFSDNAVILLGVVLEFIGWWFMYLSFLGVKKCVFVGDGGWLCRGSWWCCW